MYRSLLLDSLQLYYVKLLYLRWDQVYLALRPPTFRSPVLSNNQQIQFKLQPRQIWKFLLQANVNCPVIEQFKMDGSVQALQLFILTGNRVALLRNSFFFGFQFPAQMEQLDLDYKMPLHLGSQCPVQRQKPSVLDRPFSKSCQIIFMKKSELQLVQNAVPESQQQTFLNIDSLDAVVSVVYSNFHWTVCHLSYR